MMVLVSYDVCTIDSGGRSRLRMVAKECVNYGQRVQNSVFEIDTDYGTFLKVKQHFTTFSRLTTPIYKLLKGLFNGDIIF